MHIATFFTRMAARKGSEDLSYSQRNAGDELFDLCCDKCSTQKLNKEAAKYCSVCKEYFCDSCVKTHNSFKAMSNHIMVHPKTTIPSSTKTGSRRYHAVPKEMCRTHPMEIINMYCRREDTVGCAVCFTLEHKSCNDIHYIPEYVQSNFPAKQVKQTNSDLTKAIKAMTKLKTQHERVDDNLDKSKVTCKQEIQRYRAEINRLIDKIEAATLTELDARHKETKKKTGDANHHIQDVHNKMIRFKSEIESDQSNDSQKFVIAKFSQCMIKQGQELQSQIPNDQTSEVTFTRNTDIMTFLFSIVTLGLLSSPLMQDSSATRSSKQQTQTKTSTSPSASGGNSKTNTYTIQQQHTKVTMKSLKQGLYRATDKAECDIQQQDDVSVYNIISCCMIDTGNILLADCDNKKLKLVDGRTNTVTSSLVLDDVPFSVCRVNSTEAAVCLGDDTVQFVSTRGGGKLASVRSLSMEHDCRCIAVIRDKMYVCDDTSVYIYTLNGEFVQTIRNNKSGNAIFSGIRDITMSDDKKMIHVVDWDNGVITLNMDGDVAWRYSALRRVRGVCTDGNGNVTVCGRLAHNVIQLSPDGQYMGEIVTRSDGVHNPLSVCYDRNNHKLIVGQGDNNILVLTVH